jgi:hypothetical protein
VDQAHQALSPAGAGRAAVFTWSPGRLALATLACLLLVACSADAGDAEPARRALDLPYAGYVVSFEPGEGAGFGQSSLPDIVLGPPAGKGNEAGSLDVLSLGKGGSITLGFEHHAIADLAGPDLVVFENPFWPGGDARAVFAEPGEVSVSEDGETWLTFPCDFAGEGEGSFAGCAGVTPTLVYDPTTAMPLEVGVTGGDAFDLADLGLNSANFVRIRDLSRAGEAPTAGFDLDAVGIVSAVSLDAEP